MQFNKPDFIHRVFSSVINLSKKITNEKYEAIDSNTNEMCKLNYIVLNSKAYFNDSPLENRLPCDSLESYLTEKVTIGKVLKIAFKMTIHFVFLLIFRVFMFFFKSKNHNTILKSWIDVNFESFSNSDSFEQDAGVLVLPFPLGAKRQLHYFKMLFQKRVSFYPIGIPYSFMDFMRVLKYRDLYHCYTMELNGAKSLAKLISESFEFNEFFVMDDIDPFSAISNRLIKQNQNCQITCKLHGVGTYSPYIFCDTLIVFNDAQKVYYTYFNPIPFIKVLNKSDYSMAPFAINDIKDIKLVFMSGAATEYQDYYWTIEKRILNVLTKLCLKFELQLEVKLHPNSTLSQDALRDYNICKALPLEYSSNLISCSLYSTSYYSFGPERSFLIETEEIPTIDVFGQNARIIFEKDLESFFESYLVLNESSIND